MFAVMAACTAFPISVLSATKPPDPPPVVVVVAVVVVEGAVVATAAGAEDAILRVDTRFSSVL